MRRTSESTIKQIPPPDLPPGQEAILAAEEQVPVPNLFNRDGLIGTPIEQRVAIASVRDLQASVRQDTRELTVAGRTYLVHDPVPSLLKEERQRTIEGLARERAAQIAQEQPSTQPSLTLSEYLDDWTVTSREYTSLIDHHIRPSLGHYRLDALDRDIITAWVNSLKAVKTDGTGQVGLAVGTKRRVLRCLHKILNDAVGAHKLESNPATRITIVSNGEDEDASNPLLEHECALLLADETTRYHNHYAVLLATGMRRGEEVALMRKDLGYDKLTGKYTLMIRRSLSPSAGMKTTKTKRGKRNIELWDEAAEIILRRLKEPGSLEDPIFAGKDGQFLYPTTLTHEFAEDIKRLGLPHHRLHDLRHTHATVLLSNGWPLPEVAKRLGEDPAVTARTYAHWLPGQAARLIDEKPSLGAQFTGTVLEAKKTKVGHSGLEPETSVLSERRYKTPLVEILRHLAAIGQISQELLSCLQQDDHTAENLARFSSLTGHFWGLDKVSLPGQVEEAKSEGDKP